ncbi:MAG TPA: sigma-54 dependent transcriptional regulator [Thermoanaerobaculia bacterium]|nr:sigma-54 dependent transcriptional regulator [Thermoanaerobaculia bacterium]
MTRNRVLIVDDELVIRTAMRKFLTGAGYDVAEAENRAGAAAKMRMHRPDAVILDYKLPDGTALDVLPQLRAIDETVTVIVLTAHATIDLAVAAMKEGADQFLTKPIELPALLVILQRMLDTQRHRQSELAEKSRAARRAYDPFAGTSKAIRQLEADVQKLVTSDLPVLIQGETGSGKGVLAGWLHRNSRRRKEPFVDLNCAGLSKELLESELFGHERGAFTGAVQPKQGLLDLAHRGTFFMDEIGDVDAQVQPKLLKVLEEKQFRRLGDVKPRSADLRLIAATHHDLSIAVRERRFREDLYFRISTIVLHLPPLRERPEDLPALAQEILAHISQDMGRPNARLSDSGMRALQEHSWPGNLRELRNVLERSLLLSDSSEITRSDLRFERATATARSTEDTSLTLVEAEARHIALVLAEESNSVERAAKRLGITRNTLYYKMRKHRM